MGENYLARSHHHSGTSFCRSTGSTVLRTWLVTNQRPSIRPAVFRGHRRQLWSSWQEQRAPVQQHNARTRLRWPDPPPWWLEGKARTLMDNFHHSLCPDPIRSCSGIWSTRRNSREGQMRFDHRNEGVQMSDPFGLKRSEV